MNDLQLEMVIDIERSGQHKASGLSAVDYFMLYGTGEEARKADDRARWNSQLEEKKRTTKLKVE